MRHFLLAFLIVIINPYEGLKYDQINSYDLTENNESEVVESQDSDSDKSNVCETEEVNLDYYFTDKDFSF